MLMTWRHSGFNVFCGSRIQPGDEKAMENLARCIIRASFSQERMTYIPEESKVTSLIPPTHSIAQAVGNSQSTSPLNNKRHKPEIYSTVVCALLKRNSFIAYSIFTHHVIS